jgi:cell fate (sporulation/competence/biofilm development) regulator YlbF (YheA/YmcA/DUF963 family)
MSIETPAETADAESEAEELARELGAAVSELPAHERFAEARAAVQSDPELQERIQSFEQLRQEFAMARQSGDATQEDVREVQRAQEELHSHPTMAEFLDAKEELQDELEALNEAVSDPLAVDFGGEAGGCCQD